MLMSSVDQNQFSILFYWQLPKGHTQEQRKNDHAHIDRISWQLAQCLRVSYGTSFVYMADPLLVLHIHEDNRSLGSFDLPGRLLQSH